MFGFSKNERLIKAVLNNEHEKVLRLLDEGADVNAVVNKSESKTPAYWAAVRGYAEILSLLIDRGADIFIPTHFGHSALTVAAEHKNRNIFMLLLEKNISALKVDRKGRTMLHYAALYGHDQAIPQLLAKGAEIGTSDKYGRTALHAAAMAGHLACAELLLANGAVAQRFDHNDRTPLHAAARNGHWEICALLLDKGAEIDALDNMKWTPLHHAVYYKEAMVVETLLQRGADVTHEAKFSGGRYLTPLAVARGKGHRAIAKMLKTCVERKSPEVVAVPVTPIESHEILIYRQEYEIEAGQKLVEIFNFARRIKTVFVEKGAVMSPPAETYFDDIPSQVERLRPIWEAYQAKGGAIGVDSIYPSGVQKMRLSEIGLKLKQM